MERLFDPDRNPDQRVREDDWFPEPADSGWRDLYAVDTVADRRRWLENLEAEGDL